MPTEPVLTDEEGDELDGEARPGEVPEKGARQLLRDPASTNRPRPRPRLRGRAPRVALNSMIPRSKETILVRATGPKELTADG